MLNIWGHEMRELLPKVLSWSVSHRRVSLSKSPLRAELKFQKSADANLYENEWGLKIWLTNALVLQHCSFYELNLVRDGPCVFKENAH